nr:hypothetical protein CFP56_48710 [Quercus suber]
MLSQIVQNLVYETMYTFLYAPLYRILDDVESRVYNESPKKKFPPITVLVRPSSGTIWYKSALQFAKINDLAATPWKNSGMYPGVGAFVSIVGIDGLWLVSPNRGLRKLSSLSVLACCSRSRLKVLAHRPWDCDDFITPTATMRLALDHDIDICRTPVTNERAPFPFTT